MNNEEADKAIQVWIQSLPSRKAERNPIITIEDRELFAMREMEEIIGLLQDTIQELTVYKISWANAPEADNYGGEYNHGLEEKCHSILNEMIAECEDILNVKYNDNIKKDFPPKNKNKKDKNEKRKNV